MPAGRPCEGLEHVDRLDGSFEAKRRMKAIVQTLSGEMGVMDACDGLGIGSSRFHVLRREALQAAVTRLEPRASGRRAREPFVSAERIETLEKRLKAQEEELRRERARAAIALATGGREVSRVRSEQRRGG